MPLNLDEFLETQCGLSQSKQPLEVGGLASQAASSGEGEVKLVDSPVSGKDLRNISCRGRKERAVKHSRVFPHQKPTLQGRSDFASSHIRTLSSKRKEDFSSLCLPLTLSVS
jgi:hypothetical protein